MNSTPSPAPPAAAGGGNLPTLEEVAARAGVSRATASRVPGPQTGMGWPVGPESFTELLLRVHRDFPRLPMVVTENGAAFDDVLVDGAVHDADRIDYVHRHLAAVHAAIEAGAHVRGHYLWRTPKDSALWFRDVISQNSIPALA